MNPYAVPGISVQKVAQRRAAGDDFMLLDVRELYELDRASLGDEVVVAPLSELSQHGLEAMPADVRDNLDADVVVFCHHGTRSAQVVGWLRQQGWRNVVNMDGGIHAYALSVDRTIGFY
jgi:rhodanese-related sulfurtransferase